MKFNKNIFTKPRKKYRISFHDENTLTRIWSFKITKTGAVISILAIFIFLVFFISYLVVATPLRTLLPGYLKSELRNEYIYNNVKLDSLEENILKQGEFFANMSNILKDSITGSGNKIQKDSLSGINTDSLMSPSRKELDFVKRYDENEKFNLTVLAPLAAEGIVFAKPVAGIVEKGTPASTHAPFIDGIKIKVGKNAAVSSIYEGTVILFVQSVEDGIEIAVQHPNGFISKYKGLSSVYVSQGDKVTAAQRIGTAKSSVFGFEIWHNGTAVNPEDFISF